MRIWWIAISLSSIIACAPKHGGDDGGGSGGDYTLEITPSQSSITLVSNGTGYSAMQAYAVVAHYADGTDDDVTADATLTPNDMTIAMSGATATATAAGEYTIAAMVDDQTANATLDVELVGDSVGSGVNQTGLDGTPDPSEVPVIAYPPAGALFPINLAPLEVHAQKSDPSQTIARVTFTSGSNLAFSYYATCAASPNPTQFPNACIVTIDGSFAAQLAGVSEADDVSITVRLAAADGTMLGESQPITAAWSKTPLSGGLYYWTTAGTGDTTFNTAVARYDFDGDAGAPAIYLASNNAPTVPTGQTQCIGCHAVSKDGTKLAFSLGGSLPGYYSLYDVASVSATATEMGSNTPPFAEMTTFSPDGSREITMNYGDLSLRAADASLSMETDNLFPEVQSQFTSSEKESHPFWSPTGAHIAFVSWTPTAADISSQHDTGDMVQGGQIWIAQSDGAAPVGTASVLVPRATGVTSYYPAISDDDLYVVFDQSSCAGPANSPTGWGSGACDGYNDISATLMMVPTAGGSPIELTNANDGANPVVTNSWPRWSPDHGTFRGKELYWVAFSSRRAYGLSLQSGAGVDTTKPQLWFAAVAIDPANPPTSDPSYAAVWLPGQDPSFTGPRGNHTPVWTTKAVTIQ